MMLVNHLVINVLIVVANYEFYVISVSVTISCQISKKFKSFVIVCIWFIAVC